MIDLLNEVSNVDKTQLLELVICGPSGAGKSQLAGTAPGKILYLYASPESHGVASARKGGGNIIDVCFDRDKSGKALTPDQAYKRLLSALHPESLRKAEINSVVIDGATEIEKLVRATTEFADMCRTKNGGHDKFSEVPSTNVLIDRVMNALREAQLVCNVHVIILAIIDVQEEHKTTGAIEQAMPRLSGYGVAAGLIQQFGDILAVGKVRIGGKEGRAIQTGATVGKVSKESKDEGGRVKKFVNFDCRLQTVAGVELKEFYPADLKHILKVKAGEV